VGAEAFVTLTRVVTDDQHRDELLGLLREVVALDAQEPGTLVQTIQTVREAPNEIWLYELWAGPDALEAHRANGAELRARIFPLATEEVQVITCTPAFGHGLDLESVLAAGSSD
jgi:quinol monooxygenase YgiN